MAITITICRFCLVALLVVLPGRCAPRSKSRTRSAPETVYDQKQSGDYNIQVHLKDFQIIALLGDDTFGALGDYDYNYDYSDFTVKPVTPKPTTGTTSSTESSPTTTPAEKVKPSSTPIPTTEAPSSVPPPKETSETAPEEPLLHRNPDKNQQELASNEAENKPATSTNSTKEIVEDTKKKASDKPEETNSPGKIKVQIIETPVGIVPGEAPEKDVATTHGEMLQIRRCAQGFSRDKKGRCRRIRRPHLPYGFSRLANNLASRLKYSLSEESLPSSESTED